MAWREFKMQKDPSCPICGENPSVRELIDYEGFCGMPAREGEAADEIQECSAASFAARREAGESMTLIDVREPKEVETARIEGALWIPLGDLEARLDELESMRNQAIVVHCHHGVRSAKAVRLLLAHGFARAENLDGGIEAWSLTVDPSVPRYSAE
jgi:adenylyltransferase/sulfurtransferase